MLIAPRWRDALDKAVGRPENKGHSLYQLATVDAKGIPRVRTVGYREIIQPTDCPHLPIVLNITDIRTPKVAEMRARPHVEICWWLSGSLEQFRMSGPVRVISSPQAESGAGGLETPLLAIDTMTVQGFDWEKKRQEEFNNLPPFMRATWCKPQPASALGAYEEAKTWPQTLPKLGEAESEEDKRNQELALRNFALILIEVTEVDWVQVGTKPHQRTRFVRDGEEWSESIIVP